MIRISNINISYIPNTFYAEFIFNLSLYCLVFRWLVYISKLTLFTVMPTSSYFTTLCTITGDSITCIISTVVCITAPHTFTITRIAMSTNTCSWAWLTAGISPQTFITSYIYNVDLLFRYLHYTFIITMTTWNTKESIAWV